MPVRRKRPKMVSARGGSFEMISCCPTQQEKIRILIPAALGFMMG
jgi:hypothetical protein